MLNNHINYKFIQKKTKNFHPFDVCESAFFSSAQWPQDSRPSSYGSVD